MLRIRILLFIIILVLTSCAKSEMNWDEPTSSSPPVSEAKINRPIDEVWDLLVKNFSNDFFVINKIEKQSRTINVSFSASRPSEYADCGLTRRTIRNNLGKRQFNYNTADNSKYTTIQDKELFNYVRTTSLSGRSNIYVEPIGKGTKVSVNTKYVITLKRISTDRNNRLIGSSIEKINFTTRQRSTHLTVWYCVAKGNMEKQILDYVRN